MTADDRMLSSAEWAKEIGIKVLDPDGWDRTNLDEDWNRPISLQEFRERAMGSTILRRECSALACPSLGLALDPYPAVHGPVLRAPARCDSWWSICPC